MQRLGTAFLAIMVSMLVISVYHVIVSASVTTANTPEQVEKASGDKPAARFENVPLDAWRWAEVRRFGAIGERFQSERRDESFATVHESNIRGAFSAFPGTALVTTECRADVCRVIVTHENERSATEFRTRFHHAVAQLPVATMRVDDGARTEAYFTTSRSLFPPAVEFLDLGSGPQ